MKYNYEYIKECFEDKDYTLLSKEYHSTKDKLKYICNKHITYGEQITNSIQLLSYKKQCRLCKNEELSERENNKYIKNEKELIEMCNNNNWEYKGRNPINGYSYIKYICNYHQNKGVQLIRKDHLKDGVKCPYCKHKKLTTIDLINDKRIKDIEILGEYTKNNKKIKCKCKKCNSILYITPNSLKNGQGCKYCTISKGENKIKEILKKNNIKYYWQYKFNDCKNIKKLIFDFYIPIKNTVIEYNGEQHYYPIEYFGGISKFEKQTICDNIKREYCKNNKINLVEIPYTEFNNIEKIIEDIIC